MGSHKICLKDFMEYDQQTCVMGLSQEWKIPQFMAISLGKMPIIIDHRSNLGAPYFKTQPPNGCANGSSRKIMDVINDHCYVDHHLHIPIYI